jgi:hypothetical protein
MASYPRPVTVNLQVTSDATQAVTVLASAADVAANPVVCSTTLAASALFADLSNAVFEIWEPSSARGTLLGKVADGAMGVIQSHVGLADGLHACLTTGSLDASAATPFSGYKSASEYYSFANIGELALGYAAANLFGHPAATAAISNDAAIVANMNARAPAADAEDIASDLETKILALTQAVATGIANVVIGQDAARARDEDNNQLQEDEHIALKFYPGDKVIVSVQMTGWTSSAGAGQQYVGATTPVGATTFDFIITLS